MNTKLLMTAVLAVAAGVTAGWLVPHALQTKLAATVAEAAPATAAVPVSATPTAASADSKILYYICPMHPTIHYSRGGDCPICGMKLQPVYAGETNAPAIPSCCSSGGCGQ